MQAGRDQALNYVRTVARLARPADIRVLPVVAMRLVLVMRWRPYYARAEREPLGELAARLGSVTAALTALEFADRVTAAWPEPFTVHPACCPKLTPDEHTVALVAKAAAAGDRAAFAAALDGLVRPQRHERLFDAAIRAVCALGELSPV